MMSTLVGLMALSWPVATVAKRQMYLSRHCVRVSDDDSSIADYTTHAMPNWAAPTGPYNGWCTSGGLDIMTKTGKDLVDNFGFDPDRARFFSDPGYVRDTDTAFALMQGMGIKHASIDFDTDLFNPPCAKISPLRWDADVHARFAKLPLPGDYRTDLNELQEIIGVGPAGRLEDIDGPDAGIKYDIAGMPKGGAKVMAQFGQSMLYAYASNIPFLNVTQEQINKFTAWHAWSVNGIFDENTFFANQQTWLLRSILTALKTESTTNIYAAHDANVAGFAALLGLKWNAPPYAPTETNGELKPTPPGCGLLFEFDDENDGAVTITYVYRVFDNSDEFRLVHSEVARYESMSEFEQTIASGLKKFHGAEECYNEAAAPVLV